MTHSTEQRRTGTSRRGNEPPPRSGTRLHVTLNAAPVSVGQVPTQPLPKALETLGLTYPLTEQSRAALAMLPVEGIDQFARALHYAIDTGVPVKQLSFYLHSDPEEGGHELVARVLLDLGDLPALEQWSALTQRVYDARAELSNKDRTILNEDFSFEVRWPLGE